MTFRIDSDAEDLAAALLRAGDELRDLEPVNSRADALVSAAASPPQRTGALAASHRSAVSPAGVVWSWTAPYASFVHWGAPRHNQRAQPFGLVALEVTTPELTQLYLDHARETVSNL